MSDALATVQSIQRCPTYRTTHPDTRLRSVQGVRCIIDITVQAFPAQRANALSDDAISSKLV